MPRSGLCDTAIAVSCFEVYKTSKLHSTRSVLSRQGKLPAYQEVPERNGFMFFLLLQKEPKSTLRVLSRQGAPPHLYTQNVCAACFASIFGGGQTALPDKKELMLLHQLFMFAFYCMLPMIESEFYR